MWEDKMKTRSIIIPTQCLVIKNDPLFAIQLVKVMQYIYVLLFFGDFTFVFALIMKSLQCMLAYKFLFCLATRRKC